MFRSIDRKQFLVSVCLSLMCFSLSHHISCTDLRRFYLAFLHLSILLPKRKHRKQRVNTIVSRSLQFIQPISICNVPSNFVATRSFNSKIAVFCSLLLDLTKPQLDVSYFSFPFLSSCLFLASSFDNGLLSERETFLFLTSFFSWNSVHPDGEEPSLFIFLPATFHLSWGQYRDLFYCWQPPPLTFTFGPCTLDYFSAESVQIIYEWFVQPL